MSETERICGQMQSAFSGGAWHGPALLELLAGVGVSQAAARPIPGGHTIWEIVLHLAATQMLLLRRLDGDATGLTPEEDWRPMPGATEENWQSTLQTLNEREEELRHAVLGYAEERLTAPLIEGGSSSYNNFHGHVQHTLYHSGQISLLKKASTA
ncbi:MAG: DinB family protein [Candidatus Krumholzibacteria bacterium]|nr:DinB family protein [Candidatus Krumholzibacteria bacterium]